MRKSLSSNAHSVEEKQVVDGDMGEGVILRGSSARHAERKQGLFQSKKRTIGVVFQ